MRKFISVVVMMMFAAVCGPAFAADKAKKQDKAQDKTQKKDMKKKDKAGKK